MLRDAFVRAGYAGVRVPSLPSVSRFYEQGYLVDSLNKLKNNYVLDVGANKGWFAKHLRNAGYKETNFCFEPLRRDCATISRLSKNDPLWRVFNIALGSEDAIKPFNVISVSRQTVFSSFLSPKSERVEKTELVEVKPLDAVLDEVLVDVAKPHIFLKIDTQGYDLEVLKGAGKWIDKVCMLQSEISVTPIYDGMPHYTRTLDYYESLGFVS